VEIHKRRDGGKEIERNRHRESGTDTGKETEGNMQERRETKKRERRRGSGRGKEDRGEETKRRDKKGEIYER
jgi:hypothetical protein